ncbi:unnamed protein product [Rhizoctonia solani]|uniref:CcmS related domain-containing protein n=1 Tax=Rhizoctonia solani TaxID=456999 RepID=A0A8H3CMN6_9AGAM|nr:unnamed protein product [Rhizoctonia solani]
MASIPPTAYPHPSNFRLDHLSSRTQGQLSAPPPPTRRYSYDTPTSGLPLPSQLSTTLDGYTSSPDGVGAKYNRSCRSRGFDIHSCTRAPAGRDPRVRHAIQKIERIKEAVITFGAEQFVDTKMKGAVICNVDYRSPNHPEDLAFDWITYKDAQKTLDSTLQKSVTRTDPTNTVLVVIFLLSPSLNSLAIWRKSLSIDPTKFDRVLAYRVNKVKRETADQEKDMVIKL